MGTNGYKWVQIPKIFEMEGVLYYVVAIGASHIG